MRDPDQGPKEESPRPQVEAYFLSHIGEFGRTLIGVNGECVDVIVGRPPEWLPRVLEACGVEYTFGCEE